MAKKMEQHKNLYFVITQEKDTPGDAGIRVEWFECTQPELVQALQELSVKQYVHGHLQFPLAEEHRELLFLLERLRQMFSGSRKRAHLVQHMLATLCRMSVFKGRDLAQQLQTDVPPE